MKNYFFTFVLTILVSLSISYTSHACVGRILYIGSLENPESRLMSELLVTLINERTGTNVKIRFENNKDELYKAFSSHDENTRVDIIVENTVDAMNKINKQRLNDPNAEFSEVKKSYEKEMELIWLSPFGFRTGKHDDAISAPILRLDVLTNFPLLPRILNKLSGAINTSTYNELLNKVKNGEKAKNVAKDYLKSKKFI